MPVAPSTAGKAPSSAGRRVTSGTKVSRPKKASTFSYLLH